MIIIPLLTTLALITKVTIDEINFSVESSDEKDDPSFSDSTANFPESSPGETQTTLNDFGFGDEE